MDNDQLMTLVCLFAWLIGLFTQRTWDSMMISFYRLRYQLAIRKEFNAKQAEVAQWRAEGNVHEWKEIPLSGIPTLVCVKTGWCPSIKGYVSQQHIDSYLNAEKIQVEYKAFRDARIRLIADRNDISVFETEKIAEELFSMRKDFHLQKTLELQQEMQAKAQHVASQQT